VTLGMVSPGMGRTKLLSACVIAVCVAVAIVTLAVSGSLRVRPTVLATERLFDVDGPSLRDPPRGEISCRLSRGALRLLGQQLRCAD
jgi:hypothetical protein